MMPDPDDDPLLRALRDLPTPTADATSDRRLAREARAAFLEAATSGGTPLSRLVSVSRRAAVPVVLAGVVGIYLTWAFSMATAIVH